MKLLIDQGNSYCKWRAVGPQIELAGRFANSERYLDHDASFASLLSHGIKSIYMASVARKAFRLSLIDLCQRLFDLQAQELKVEDGFQGLKLAYKDVASLGIDRWLMMIAARQQCTGPFVVVSAGTALAVDLVDAEGQHLGGLIAPGWALLKSALQQDASEISVSVTAPIDDRALGNSTLQCLHAGSSVMICDFIRGAIRRHAPEAATRFLCGGDGPRLHALLGETYRLNEALVLDGLELISREAN